MLVIIVFASGCTSPKNIITNTYSANGVTFNYPENWMELNSSSVQPLIGSQGTVIAAVGEDSDSGFAIAKLNLDDLKLASLSELASVVNTTQINQGFTYESQNLTTVDSVNAYEITYQYNGTYLTDVIFYKNGNGYIAFYVDTNNNQQNLQMILNSLKIT